MTAEPDRPTILELRHVECESPGSYSAGLAPVADMVTVRSWREPVPTDPSPYAAILVMGGPMGADDGATIPWIADELALLRRAVAADIPIWGVCLGSQLLAHALGAAISTAATPEIGVSDVELTSDGRADPVWSHVPTDEFPTLQWHFDTFDIPDGAVRLASSSAYPNQVFRHRGSYGVQFHLEVDAALFDEWLEIEDYRTELTTHLGEDAVHATTAAVARVEPTTRPIAETVIRRWFDEYVR
ncbi:type 1 glutamine amidotransferase [Gordonia soli]|uniref:Glutamine amidotransferase domain-containing protein n=1 Tax=Gordonia soli NBRC 108243 TaxID=1223545 RepID=M0QMN3_9ACTN|nr:type 1 glutamine amidotransferase [Gordonia soli]GAC69828.1 hypothetical protein GS4_28_00770 [Gordonia soli NBRC 108243]